MHDSFLNLQEESRAHDKCICCDTLKKWICIYKMIALSSKHQFKPNFTCKLYAWNHLIAVHQQSIGIWFKANAIKALAMTDAVIFFFSDFNYGGLNFMEKQTTSDQCSLQALKAPKHTYFTTSRPWVKMISLCFSIFLSIYLNYVLKSFWREVLK